MLPTYSVLKFHRPYDVSTLASLNAGQPEAPSLLLRGTDMTAIIRMAHTVSRKHGVTTYRAGAYVLDGKFKHSRALALGDTKEEAERGAIKRVHDAYNNTSERAPATINNVGKVSDAFLAAWLF